MSDFREVLETLSAGRELEPEQASDALEAIIAGKVSNEETAAFLFGMRSKGETTRELTEFVKVMRNAAVQPEVDVEGAVDLCGTGGDNSGTFNISTAAMFVAAGDGVPVLKHGNRSVSSRSGSADVLEEMGAVIDLDKNQVETVFRETGMAFMFAPNFHPAMKHVMPARQALGIRTFFNILGPLLNPAGVRRQVVGAFSKEVARQIIHILSHLETEQAFSVNAHDGLDEVSLCSQSEIFELNGNMVTEAILFDPRSLGYEWGEPEELQGGDAQVNAGIIRDILGGEGNRSAREIVLLNAAFAIRASGAASSLEEASGRAKESVRSGAAAEALETFVTATREVAG